MEIINKDYVLKVADLAKLSVTDEKVEKYIEQLSDIMGEINKITTLTDKNGELFLSPSKNKNDFSKGEVYMINKELVLREANSKDSEFIIVPKVIE